jgi:membrane protease YdiL (CAAX protease family)
VETTFLNRRIKVICLILSLLYLGSVLHRMSTPRPDESHLSVLTERLALAGEFCDQLSPSLRRVLTGLALYLEKDPVRHALYSGRSLSPGAALVMSDELRLWMLYRDQPELRDQLRVLAYGGLLRLNYCLAPVLLLLVSCGAAAIAGRRETALFSKTTGWGAWAVLAIYFGWDLAHTHVLSSLTEILAQESDPLIAFVVFQVLSLALLVLLLSRQGGLKKPTDSTSRLGWVGQGYLMAFFGVFVIEEVERFCGVTLPTPPVIHLLNKPGNVLLFAFLVVVVVPLYEELIFRHWLMGGLQPVLGSTRALFLSTILFALAHASLVSLPALLFLGWVFGWTYLKSGSLTAVVILHGLWNLTSVCHLMAAAPW